MVPELFDPDLYRIARYAPVFAAPFVGSLLALWIGLRATTAVPLDGVAPLLGLHVDPGLRRLIEISSMMIAWWAATVFAGWQLWITCLAGWTLLSLALIDYRQLVLPNAVSLSFLMAGLVVAAAGGMPSFADAAVGAAAGFGVFAAVGWLYGRLRGREGLGLGDAKLLAAAGAWVGWGELPAVVLIASLAAVMAALGASGGVIRLDDPRPVAFGPYLGFALWLSLLYGPFLA